jgi:60 kDa SS-A/Ro ribonucleoprotein
MATALKSVSAHSTDQRTRARADQVENSAGGFVFKTGPMEDLRRFLILGTEGGTYYAGQRQLTEKNLGFLEKALKISVKDYVNTVVEISTAGRAPKNSQAIFALAFAMANAETDKDVIRSAVGQVCRTSTHLFEFSQYIENLAGWGRAKRGAVADWYSDKDADRLAYQAVKYRQRDGWTHRDLLRLSHPKADSAAKAAVYDWISGRGLKEDAPAILGQFEAMQAAKTEDAVVELLSSTNLPWETVPTEFHKSLTVWRTLFEQGNMGQTALLRNVTRFAKLGAFKDMRFAAAYAEALADPTALKEGRVHPISVLSALRVYEDGAPDRVRGYGRTKDWETTARIRDGLERAFYAAFGSVESSGKRQFLAIDVSGSMSTPVTGVPGLSCAEASAVMAMVTARTEQFYEIRGFTSGSRGWGYGSAVLTDLGFSASDTLATATRKTRQSNFGGTDCSLPMVWAKENDVEIDTFVVYTDNETWAGKVQPFQALKQYRKASGINAKLVVVGMASNGFTIADPSDPGMLDVVGLDSAAPQIISEFSRG